MTDFPVRLKLHGNGNINRFTWVNSDTPRIYDAWSICDMLNAMAEMRFYSSKESEQLPTQDENTTAGGSDD